MYHPWRERLAGDVDLYAVQLPGREGRYLEEPLRSLPELVETMVPSILAIAERPLILFGHSMGAVVAFEIARRLRRENRSAAALLVSGRVAPHLAWRAPPVAHLPTSEVVRQIALRHGGIPDALLLDVKLTEVLGRALQADLDVIEGYTCTPDAPLDCPITAVGGLDDTWVLRHELDLWRQHTAADFSCIQFPGDHFYFNAPSARDSLLACIRRVSRRLHAESDWVPAF